MCYEELLVKIWILRSYTAKKRYIAWKELFINEEKPDKRDIRQLTIFGKSIVEYWIQQLCDVFPDRLFEAAFENVKFSCISQQEVVAGI